MHRTVVALGSIAILTACQGQSLNLGDGQNGAPGQDACPADFVEDAGLADAGGDAYGAVDADAGSSLDPLLGTWQGYEELGPNIVLAFTKQANGAITGTVTYGQAAPPPPPTDPNVGYPPGFPSQLGPPGPYRVDGFPYTALRVSFDGTRLQLQTNQNEAWKAWCELQTPTGDGWPCGQYGCIPNGSGMADFTTNLCTVQDPVTGKTVTLDCGKWTLCHNPGLCSCTATHCTADMSYPDTSLDLQLSGSHLDGSITGPGNVHFTLSP
jgi:hypothetical protein